MTKKTNLTDPILSAKVDRYWTVDSNARKNLDWQWFQYDLWVSGHHYAKYDRNTQQIEVSPKSDGKPKVVINMIYWTLRSIRNYVMRNDPKPDVMPDDMTDETMDQAVVENKFLSFIHNKLGLRQKLRMTLWHALKYSNGYWQVLWDEEKQEFKINVVDPYDLYWDGTAKEPNEARRVTLAVRRNIDDLKEDPMYKGVDWDSIQTDNQLASSSLKSRILAYERGGTNLTGNKDAGTVILKEFWLKENKKSTDEKGNETSQPVIRIVTKIGKQIIRNEVTDLTRIPVFRLPADIEPLSMYGQGWVKNLIPMNREINRLESSAAEYNALMNKAKIMAPKGHGIRTINSEHGQIIQYKKGYNPEPLPVAPLSPALAEQAERMQLNFENGASFHDASLGRIPTGAKSGVSIEALQEGDSNNLSELVENTEVFLEEVYEYILYLASQKYQFARNIAPTTQTGEREYIKVIGEAASNQPEDAQVIHAKNVVDVKIDSYLAYTQAGRQDAIQQLQKMIPNLDPIDILQAYRTGNIADIVQRIEQNIQKQAAQAQQQQQAQIQAQAQAQQQTQAAQAQQQQANVPQPAGQGEAIAIIRLVLNGHMPQSLPAAISPDFINYFDKFLTSDEGKQLPKDVQKVLLNIRDQAAGTMNGGQQPNQLVAQTA